MMKKIIAICLCLVLAASGMLTAQAALAPLQVGDVNRSYGVDIADATLIQRFLAHLREPDELEIALSDADGDGEMTILDATAIQRKLAGIQNNFVEDYIYDYYVGDASFHSTAQIEGTRAYHHESDNEICYVGIPVTFTGRVRWGASPRRYTLTVDDNVVGECQADGRRECGLIYTFDTEGEYTVKMTADCQYGVQCSYTHKVKVVRLPKNDKPVIMGATFFDASWMSSGDDVLTVTAVGGTAPYRYRYEYAESPDGMYSGYDESTSNRIKVSGGKEFQPGWTPLYVKVTVCDARGVESDPVTVSYNWYELEA